MGRPFRLPRKGMRIKGPFERIVRMENLRNIVVGIEFSSHSRKAFLEAKRIAMMRRARLHLFHVAADVGMQDLASGLGTDYKEMWSETEAKAHGKMEAMIAESGDEELEYHLEVRSGNPFKEIQKFLNEINPGLLVLGSRGIETDRGDISQLAIQCIRKVKAKVLIVRRANDKPFKVVGAFIDFSKNSENIIQQAAYVAKTDGAKLHLFHVYLPPWRVRHFHAPTREYTPEAMERHKGKILARMRKTKEAVEKESSGVETEYSLIESSEKIIGIDEFIKETGSDLVVLSTRSRTGFRAVLLRTIAEHIIRTSPCSVLAIKS